MNNTVSGLLNFFTRRHGRCNNRQRKLVGWGCFPFLAAPAFAFFVSLDSLGREFIGSLEGVRVSTRLVFVKRFSCTDPRTSFWFLLFDCLGKFLSISLLHKE